MPATPRSPRGPGRFSCPPEPVAPVPKLAPPPARTPRPARRRNLPSPETLRDRGLPPDGAAVSANEYRAISLNTNLLVERVDGRLEYLPMPSRNHQGAVWFMADALRDHARSEGWNAGTVFSPFPMIVNGRECQPDVLFVRDGSDPRCDEAPWTWADLLAEVVSPDDPNRDRVEKRIDYAAARIPEYWMIDPRPRVRTISVLTLDGAAYRDADYGEGETAVSVLLPGFTVDVTACLDAR